MRIFILNMLILSVCSCRVFKPEQFCAENYPPQVSDSISHDTAYVWDTVFINVPGAEISFDTTFIPPNVVFHKEEKKGRLTTTVSISNGKLTFKCKEDELRDSISILKKEITVTKSKTEIIEEPCKKKHLKGFHTFCVWFFWLVLILFVLRFLIKYFTGK